MDNQLTVILKDYSILFYGSIRIDEADPGKIVDLFAALYD
ncbi:hypothetical protein H1P_280015 [Hyella patelloides LEGE 07179]|uniref:Uncharacterized protein n=2 Tax=Hyella TaxID=945733 RepID=A0A563VTG5_9CYAN|nr:hypothetical protein H1P_280015 [Hyella patelloides LEGE 07179]